MSKLIADLPVTRNQDFYFSDGNVIFRVSQSFEHQVGGLIERLRPPGLQVEDKLYKLHKSLLIRDSEVFAGMFSLPDTLEATRYPIASGYIEGKSDQNPIVLEGQDKNEFETFLKFYYPAYVKASFASTSYLSDKSSFHY